MVEDAIGPPEIAGAVLESVVRNLLGEPAAVVTDGWTCRPLGGGAGEGLGLYRISGSARVGSATAPWSLVLKVCAAAGRADPTAWDYPVRERLAYGSGLLAALPGGIAAPRFLADETRRDGTGWLWLEAIAEAHHGPWPLDRYARAATSLGHFNGAYLTGAPLPDDPWLSRGWLRAFVAPSETFVGELGRLAGPGGPPLVRRLYPPPVVAEIERLWAERERFFTVLDGLPRTFCHHDAFRRNLLYRAGPDGEELLAIDWAYAGHGAVGEDLGQMVMGSLFFFEVEGAGSHEIDAACFAGYLTGLREAGWFGDERLVRLGFATAAALRHTVGLLHLLCPALSDPAQRPVMEDLFGAPLDEVVRAWAGLWPFQFDLAEEARTLMSAVGQPTARQQPILRVGLGRPHRIPGHKSGSRRR